jgi:hypothetical protein
MRLVVPGLGGDRAAAARAAAVALLLALARSVAASDQAVVVDILPGLCPNHLRIDSPLTVPVGILGTEDLDAGDVDPATMRLSREGSDSEVEPLTYTYRDVGSPPIGGRCACYELPGDGLDDLVLRFDIKALAAALGLSDYVGQTVVLRVSGRTVTGRGISGVDCALVIDAAWSGQQLEQEIGFLADAGAPLAGGRFTFAYFTDVADHLTLSIYDLRGGLVDRLVDRDMAPGIYHATWDCTGPGNRGVAPGTYFARLSNGRGGETRKISVPHP